MGAPRKRVRVRTARWPGAVCPVCRAPVLGGQQIASVRRADGRPGPWVHVGHVIAAGRARRAS